MTLRRHLVPTGGLLLLLAFQIGCAATRDPRSFEYDIKDVPILSGGPLREYSLGIEVLVDERPQEVRAREGGFRSPAVVDRGGDDWYFNSDNYYKLPTAWGITRGIVGHIAATGLFQSVARASEVPDSDLVFSGVLEKFEAYRDREAGKEALVGQMGLIGLAIQATDTSPYEAHVVLSNLKLSRRSDGAVLWEGRIEENQEGDAPISMLDTIVYDHALDALKAAVNALIDELSRVDPAAVPASDDTVAVEVADPSETLPP